MSMELMKRHMAENGDEFYAKVVSSHEIKLASKKPMQLKVAAYQKTPQELIELIKEKSGISKK